MGKILKLSSKWEPAENTIVKSYGDSIESLPRVIKEVEVARHSGAKLEVKSVVSSSDSFYDFLRGSNLQNLAAFQALSYYTNVSIIYDAIDDIITPGKVIQPVLFNEKKQDWIVDHELLDLLNKPGGGMNGQLFRESWLLNKLAVGTSFMIATGNKDKPPLELLIGYAQDMTLDSDRNGFLNRIIQSGTSESNTYTRDDTVADNMFRYFSKDEQKEMHISRTSNIRFGGTNQWGLSPLKPLMLEIEQFISQNVHNDSILKRGATPSLLFSSEGSLSDDQYTRLNDSVIDYYQGAMNAGQPIIGENGMTVSNLSITNKDMDYDNMVKSLSARMYNIYNIPLPSVMTGTMTMANLEASRLIKYDDAILPAVNDMFSELTGFLVPRYRDLEGYFLTYDPASIEALEPRRLANATVVKGLNVISTDEMRTTFLKREPLGGAGDEVLIPSNLLPLTSDKFTDDQAEEGIKPSIDTPDEEEEDIVEDIEGDTLLEEIDEDETDAAKFIAVVKRTLGLSDDEALSQAIEHNMIKSTAHFIKEIKRLKGLNEAEALLLALDDKFQSVETKGDD